MEPRIAYNKYSRNALHAMFALEKHLKTHAPDDVYEAARKEFTENELVDLTYAVATINAWNRIAISMRAVPGQYHPGERRAAAT